MKTLRDRELERSSVERSSPGRRRRRSIPPRDPNQLILAHSAVLTFLGLTLGVFVSRKFLVIPIAAILSVAQEIGKDRLMRNLAR